MIRGLDDVEIVLNYYDSILGLSKSFKDLNQLMNVSNGGGARLEHAHTRWHAGAAGLQGTKLQSRRASDRLCLQNS